MEPGSSWQSTWRSRWTSRRPPSAEARVAVRSVVLTHILANGVGGAIVFLYLRLLFPKEIAPTPGEGALPAIVFAIYLTLALVGGVPLNALLLRRAVSWVRDDREPTEQERRLTYKLPLLETLTAFITWLGAAVIFGVINESGRRIALGIALAGLLTSSMLYLLLEAQFRPVFARALKDAEDVPNRRDVLPRIMLAWWIGSAVPLLALGLTPLLVPEIGDIDRVRLTVLIITSLVAGGILLRVAVASVARPINRVRKALGEVAEGNLDVTVPLDDLGELGRLAEGFNDMVDGLREREELRDRIGRQVGLDPELALEAQLGDGERRNVTVVFVDLDGYTAFSESRHPEAVVAMLNRFFAVVVTAVHRHGGFVNKFEGDAALCLFGAPSDQPDHAARAVAAAEEMIAAVTDLPGALPASAGVASGEVLAGHVGTAERYEYTVIGDVVNLSSRLCTQAKIDGVDAYADAATAAGAGSLSEWSDAGLHEIRGRAGAVHLWSHTTAVDRARTWTIAPQL